MGLNVKRTSIYLAMACITVGLAGCGGGGGGGAAFPLLPPSDSQPAATTVSGTAATGMPIANANVTIRCANTPPVTVTTTDMGRWSVDLAASSSFPCLVTVSGGSLPAGTSLHSLAVAAGNVNVTPLTELVLAKAAQAAPSTLEDAGADALTALAEQLQGAQEQVLAILASAGYPTASIDLLTADFNPAKGDVYDDLLEQLSLSLADDGSSYDELLQTVASSGDSSTLPEMPLTTTFKAGDLAAMHQLNNGALSVADSTLTMALTASGPQPVGAYVGGGDGNKAVLQLPGLAGVKMSDLKNIEIDLKGDAAGVTTPSAPVPYLNFTVDLHCDSTPLAADATLNEVRARRRIVIFDTFYHFVQASPQLSSTDFTTISITPTTPSWRTSAGDPVGSMIVSGQESGGANETLDFSTYPDACIVDGATGDGGMPRDATADSACNTANALDGSAPASCGAPYKGAILVLGDSSTKVASQWSVKRLSIESKRKQTFRFE
jgi:hypothetical protein